MTVFDKVENRVGGVLRDFCARHQPCDAHVEREEQAFVATSAAFHKSSDVNYTAREPEPGER